MVCFRLLTLVLVALSLTMDTWQHSAAAPSMRLQKLWPEPLTTAQKWVLSSITPIKLFLYVTIKSETVLWKIHILWAFSTYFITNLHLWHVGTFLKLRLSYILNNSCLMKQDVCLSLVSQSQSEKNYHCRVRMTTYIRHLHIHYGTNNVMTGNITSVNFESAFLLWICVRWKRLSDFDQSYNGNFSLRFS